jgi:hypothetical protein
MPEKLKFFDVKAKRSFETDNYRIEVVQTSRGPMKVAKAVSPYTGITATRFLGRA